MKKYIKADIEVFKMEETDVIVTSYQTPIIPLPDDEEE